MTTSLALQPSGEAHQRNGSNFLLSLKLGGLKAQLPTIAGHDASSVDEPCRGRLHYCSLLVTDRCMSIIVIGHLIVLLFESVRLKKIKKLKLAGSLDFPVSIPYSSYQTSLAAFLICRQKETNERKECGPVVSLSVLVDFGSVERERETIKLD
ncbi:unnamed protein product [Fusarium graminearum]|nr:unnamed protein product [Fusarium graminearum]